MKKMILIGFALLNILPLFADPVCNKCIRIREENKTKDFNHGHVYYEDYLKEGEDKNEKTSSEELK